MKIYLSLILILKSKSAVIKIIAEHLFDCLQKVYENTTYLKMSFLIPDNVIGFIIGIEGKNINQIREETNAKIEVYSPNNTRNYRKIEITGDPQGIVWEAEKIYSFTRRYFYFNMPKFLNRNDRDRERDRRDMEERDNRERDFNNYKDRNYGGYRNKEYNNPGYKDKDYKGMYNKERNEYKDVGYKNDYKGGYRNFGNNRDNRDNREMRDYYDKNSGYYRENYRDYRDSGPRYKNNFDRNNSKYYYDKNKNNNNGGDNDDSKNGDNRSRKSYSRKSGSEYSKDLSYSNDRYYNSNNDEFEKKEYSEEEMNNNNKEEVNNDANKNENSNDDKQKLEPGEEKDSNIINDKVKDNDNQKENENNIDVQNNENENKINNDNENNNNEEKINTNNDENKIETDDINNILAKDGDENDSKLCKIIINLSSEEINLLNTLKNNIWINLENTYHCTISKEKSIDNQDISIITFNGTPKQNSLALYQLQKYLLDTKNVQTDVNKKDN